MNLAAVMRIAGARTVEIEIAQQRLAEAQAAHRALTTQFFPHLQSGFTFKGHDGNIQAVEGKVFDASKQSLAVGVAVVAQLELGESIYKAMVSRQKLVAYEFKAEAEREESTYRAIAAFFELVRATASEQVALEAVKLAEEYTEQVKQAVNVGVAFKGNEFRAAASRAKNRIAATRAAAQRRIAAARLATLLRLSPTVDIRAEGGEPAPLRLFDTIENLDALVAKARKLRPETKQSLAERDAAAKARAGALYAPYIPSLRADYAYGGLGGGRFDGVTDRFDESHDYSIGLSWRLGPGGIGDRTRIDTETSRLRAAQLATEQVELEISRQTVEARTRVLSLRDELAIATEGLVASEKAAQLSRQRSEFGVGEVLERIEAEQELVQARLGYLATVTDYNLAQFALRRALGVRLSDGGW
jgi:outer membrane protein TolC